MRTAPLAMSRDDFQRVGHELVDRIAEHLATLPDRPVTPDESPYEVRRALGSDDRLPDAGIDAGLALADATRLLFEDSLFNGHPRFFGYITSSPAPLGMLGDFLAAAANQNTGAWKLSPMATEIERQTVRWIAELIGFPADCGGLLVSGGNMANFVCFLAVRTAKAGWDARKTGLRGALELAVYASTETHTWIQKATDLFGLGTDAIRWIPVDDCQQMIPSALRRQIEEDRERGARSSSLALPARSVQEPWIRFRSLPTFVASSISGFTSTARMARLPLECPARRMISGASAKLIRLPSTLTNGCTRRSRPVAF
jgi:aromatic-L-amino-acid/L-tryptophan decarboxylase